MANVYEQIGVRTIINAAGPVTRLSGAVMQNEAVDAMREAGANPAFWESLRHEPALR